MPSGICGGIFRIHSIPDTAMPKPSLPFLFCFLFSLTVAAITATHPVHATDLSEGLKLYQDGKQHEAIPLLEKAAKEGHEEAIRALDRIYAGKTPAIDMTDDTLPVHKNPAATAESPTEDNRLAKAVPVPRYEKATVAEDPKEVADRAFMRKMLLSGLVVIIVLAGIIQYFLLRRMRNRQYRRETPADIQSASGKKRK